MKKYPCWMYHATEAPRLVRDPLEQAALGPGWGSWAEIHDPPRTVDSPAREGDAMPPDPAPQAETVDPPREAEASSAPPAPAATKGKGKGRSKP